MQLSGVITEITLVNGVNSEGDHAFADTICDSSPSNLLKRPTIDITRTDNWVVTAPCYCSVSGTSNS